MPSCRSWPRSARWGLATVTLASITLAAVTLAVLAVESHAESPAIRQRQTILDKFGEAVKEPGSMLRQEAPFDLGVVRASLKTLAEGAPKLKPLFPDDSRMADGGGYTEALPMVWEKKEPFFALLDKLATDAAAASTIIKDEATFRAEWGKVSANCRNCHKVYRMLPKN